MFFAPVQLKGIFLCSGKTNKKIMSLDHPRRRNWCVSLKLTEVMALYLKELSPGSWCNYMVIRYHVNTGVADGYFQCTKSFTRREFIAHLGFGTHPIAVYHRRINHGYIIAGLQSYPLFTRAGTYRVIEYGLPKGSGPLVPTKSYNARSLAAGTHARSLRIDFQDEESE